MEDRPTARYTADMPVVAVIGASASRHKYGNKAVRAFHQAGYTVVPVTPRHDEVEGLKAYATIADVPGPIDMVTVYVPPQIGETLLDGIAARQVGEVWLNPGAESPALVERARALGLAPILACSIIGAGQRPSDF
jgi:predicted CoA-binding protein